MSIRIAILGHGRIGQEIRSCIAESEDLQIASIWMREGSTGDSHTPYVLSESLASALAPTDDAIDFTLAEATDQVITAAIDANIPLVCGVSGLTAESRERMHDAARKIPILYDRNTAEGQR